MRFNRRDNIPNKDVKLSYYQSIQTWPGKMYFLPIKTEKAQPAPASAQFTSSYVNP